jgi:hypothetical protein
MIRKTEKLNKLLPALLSHTENANFKASRNIVFRAAVTLHIVLRKPRLAKAQDRRFSAKG